jgi:hypothetical protein
MCVKECLISKVNITFPAIESARRQIHTFPLKENIDIGFTNLKIEGNLTDTEIDMILFEIGGTRILKFAEKYDGYVSFPLLNDNILPAVKIHEFKLYIDIEPNKEVKISYDIVKISNPIGEWKMMINQKQRNGSKILHLGHNRTRLNFDHQIEKIVIKSDEPISNVFMTLDEKYTIPLQKINGQYYECIFDKTINFTMVHNAFIEFDCPYCPSSDDIRYYLIYAYSINRLMSECDMIALSFGY